MRPPASTPNALTNCPGQRSLASMFIAGPEGHLACQSMASIFFLLIVSVDSDIQRVPCAAVLAQTIEIGFYTPIQNTSHEWEKYILFIRKPLTTPFSSIHTTSKVIHSTLVPWNWRYRWNGIIGCQPTFGIRSRTRSSQAPTYRTGTNMVTNIQMEVHSCSLNNQ